MSVSEVSAAARRARLPLVRDGDHERPPQASYASRDDNVSSERTDHEDDFASAPDVAFTAGQHQQRAGGGVWGPHRSPVVVGSFWIMTNLNDSMMPAELMNLHMQRLPAF